MKSEIRSSIVFSRENSGHSKNEGSLNKHDLNGSPDHIGYDSPFIQLGADINQSTAPLNAHYDDDHKHSFFKDNPPNSDIRFGQRNKNNSIQKQQQYQDDQELNNHHLRGAEQRQKMFIKNGSQEMSDHQQLKQQQPSQQQPKNEDDYADEINSPSLTSNSSIFQQSNEKMKSAQINSQNSNKVKILAISEDTQNSGVANGVKIKQVSRQSLNIQAKQVTTDVTTSKQESMSLIDKISQNQNPPLLQMYAKENSAKQFQIGESQKVSPNRGIEEVSVPQSLNNSSTQFNPQRSFPLFQGISSVTGVGGGIPMGQSNGDRNQSGTSSPMSAHIFNSVINKNSSNSNINNNLNNNNNNNNITNLANEIDLYPHENAITGFTLEKASPPKAVNVDTPQSSNQQNQGLRSLPSSSIAGGQNNNLMINNLDQGKNFISFDNTRRGSHYLEIPQANNNNNSNINTNTFTSNPSQYGRRNSQQSQVSQLKDRPKKRNFLKAFFYTYKFLSKMRFVRKYKNIYMLEKKHFKLIKDYSFGGLYERNKEHHLFVKLCGNLYYYIFDIKSPFHAFQPNSFLLLIFELLLFFVLLFLIFYIPIKVCFEQLQDYYEPPALSSFLSSIPYVLLLEVFVSANTAYFAQGATINDRKLIIKRYLGFKFWIDILTIISLTQSSIIPLLFILRISQVFKILNEIDEYFQISFKFPTYFELFKLIIIIIFMAHICACGFRLILEYQTVPKTWLTSTYLTHQSWSEIYVASLYFSFTTMITVGFGDIVPQSILERVYVIIIQLVSCGVFAYAINTIGSIFQEIAKKSAEYRQQKQEIIDYMTRRDISKATSIKILKYLEYYHSSGENGHQKGYNVLSILSKRLKDQVYKEYYGGLLLQFKLLSRQFSEKFLRTLSLYMKETTLSPGEILYNQGELDQRIFYVQTGEIEQYIDLQDNGHKDIILGTFKVISRLRRKKGDYFGQYGFLGNLECKSSARSLNVSQMVYCTIEDFVTVIRQFPNDYETYCQLKDGVQFNQEQIDIVCSSCGRYSHMVHECPLLHYEIDKEAHIRRWVHSDPQKRDETFTRKKPFFHLKSSEDKNATRKTTSSQSPPKNERKMNYRHQRFNVLREMGDLKTNLRFMRVKLGAEFDDEKMQLGEEEVQLMNELSDYDFLMKTRIPMYQTDMLKKQRQQMRRDLGEIDDNYDQEDEEDPYEEEFAGYEDIMDNEDTQYQGGGNNTMHNVYGIQRMSTLTGSQVHVPTEKSVFIRMPSTNSFHPSGKNEMVQENTSEDKEDDDDEDDDEDEVGKGDNNDNDDDKPGADAKEKRTKALSDDSTNQNLDNERSFPIYGKHQSSSRKSSALSGQGSSQQMHQVSFREEMMNQPRKVSTPRQSKIDAIINNTSIYEEEVNSPIVKSRFYKGPENTYNFSSNLSGVQASPQRFQNRHQTVTVASSFNNISHNFETYLRSSNLENPTSMNSIILQNQNSKRKGTVLSSIGQGSSKLRNQGSLDISLNNFQRTGTLNSRGGIIRNSNRNITKKASDQKSFSKQTTILSKSETKKDSHTKIGQSGTQYAKFANTRTDIVSEKKLPNSNNNNNFNNSSKSEITTLFVVMDFEKFCEFTHYFPEQNLSNILKLLKKDQKKQELLQQQFQASNKILKTAKTGRTPKFAGQLLAGQQKRNPTEQQSNYNRASIVMNNTISNSLAMSQQGLTMNQEEVSKIIDKPPVEPILREQLSQFARNDQIKKIIVTYNE